MSQPPPAVSMRLSKREAPGASHGPCQRSDSASGAQTGAYDEAEARDVVCDRSARSEMGALNHSEHVRHHARVIALSISRHWNAIVARTNEDVRARENEPMRCASVVHTCVHRCFIPCLLPYVVVSVWFLSSSLLSAAVSAAV